MEKPCHHIPAYKPDLGHLAGKEAKMETRSGPLSRQAALALHRLWLSLGAASAMELEACKARTSV